MNAEVKRLESATTLTSHTLERQRAVGSAIVIAHWRPLKQFILLATTQFVLRFILLTQVVTDARVHDSTRQDLRFDVTCWAAHHIQ